MFGKAAEFNRDMYQISIASMDVLMQLVQIVERVNTRYGICDLGFSKKMNRGTNPLQSAIPNLN